MRVIEARGTEGTIAVLVIPFTSTVSNSLNLTAAVTNSARYFGSQAVLVVNTDHIRAWRGSPERPTTGLRFLWQRPTAELLGPYMSGANSLEKAGESTLSGYVEAWLSDLAIHWRHAPEAVPGEAELAREGIRVLPPDEAVVGVA